MGTSILVRWVVAASVAVLTGHPAPAQQSDTIVKLASAPRYRGVATLVPELTIGVADGAPEYMFSSVSDLFVARDGSILVLDYPNAAGVSIRHYTADGKFLRQIGRRGQGPGEYQAPTGIAQLPDGRLIIRDITGRRINVYSEVGEPVATWSLPGYSYAIRGRDGLRVDPRGIIYMPFSMSSAGPTTPAPTPRTGILRLRVDGTVIDTLLSPDLPDIALPSVISTTTEPGGRRFSLTSTVAYSPRMFWSWSPRGYFVTGFTNRYAIDMRIAPAPARGASPQAAPPSWRPGDPVTSIRRNLPAIAVGPAERRDQRAYTEATLQRPGAVLSGSLPEVPSVKPFFKSVGIAHDGRIWVSLSTPSERFDPPPLETPPGQLPNPVLRWREPTLHDVFDPDGTWIGQVGTPVGTTISWRSGDTAWGVVRDEDDVQVVKRFRIAWR